MLASNDTPCVACHIYNRPISNAQSWYWCINIQDIIDIFPNGLFLDVAAMWRIWAKLFVQLKLRTTVYIWDMLL
jgi:hypothetical protein